MDWNMCYTVDKAPTLEQFASFVQSSLWLQFNSSIQNKYQIQCRMEYSRCSMQRGWNIKYKKCGKSLCTLYPMQGYFIVLVVIGVREMNEAELMIPLCSEYVKRVFKETKAGQGQKWLMLDVKNECIAEDILSLIALRVKPKK